MGGKFHVPAIPGGFVFSGESCGIKRGKELDIALALCTEPNATAAAVFTRNSMAAAPVQLSRKQLDHSSHIRFVITNSGNANAGTGAEGELNAKEMLWQTAKLLSLPPSQGLVASTGVIGCPLPMAAVQKGIRESCANLSPQGFHNFAEAILTTDLGPKTAVRQNFNRDFTLLGCTKGAGMIRPNMATTLSYVFTDLIVDSEVAQRALRKAADASFNTISVDGDTSTNDMLLLMASGSSETKVSEKRLTSLLTDLLSDLSFQLMADGEGVGHVPWVRVTEAKNVQQAQKVVSAISNSPLVKTAIHGCDPNWGRLLSAIGNANVDTDRVTISIGGHKVFSGGPCQFSELAVHQVMSEMSYTIKVDLGVGASTASGLFCDLSHQYVEINASYRS